MLNELVLEHGLPFNHASSILALADGGFFCAWFGGSSEGDADTAIWGCRRGDDGWGQARIMAKIRWAAHWNPVLFRLPDHRIALYFKTGASIAGWRTYVMYSANEGKDWTDARELVPGDDSGGRGPVKNKPIRLSNGLILAPSSVERESWRPVIDVSFSGGRGWGLQAPVPMPDLPAEDARSRNRIGLIQPTLWESSPGRVHMLLRSNVGNIYRSDSSDFGLHWSEAAPTRIPNNNSGIDVGKLSDGRLVLVGNPEGVNQGTRQRIASWISGDNGSTWSGPHILEDAAGAMSAPEQNPELSYPAVVIDQNDHIAVTYTWHRQSIRFLYGTVEEFQA